MAKGTDFSSSAISLIKAGKLRPIAVTSRERVPALAYAPAMLQIVHAAAVKALASAELQKKLVEQGGIPAPGTPEAFRALIVADSKKFAQIIREVGIPMEG